MTDMNACPGGCGYTVNTCRCTPVAPKATHSRGQTVSDWLTNADYPTGGPCYPIALCNALLWYGCDPPVPGTDEWEDMIDIAGCRHGAATCHDEAERYLGVVVTPWSINRGIEPPLVLAVHDPKLGLHSITVIEAEGGRVHVVNYGGRGPTWMPFADLDLARNVRGPVRVFPTLATRRGPVRLPPGGLERLRKKLENSPMCTRVEEPRPLSHPTPEQTDP